MNVELETKLVGEIKGDFYIPSYQRGYRWDNTEVVRLLDDIYSTEGKRNYCLQPVVVMKKQDGKYELIDGQQRLTTIYLIYKIINKPKFDLSYARERSGEFLKSIGEESEKEKEQYIDFWFIYNAYKCIKDWFDNKDPSAITDMNTYFDNIVKIIWYEIDASEDAIDLFSRLNIGKIPLTNAELVKAMFLSRDTDNTVKQDEISFQWDSIERELHNNSLWCFLTNRTNSYYRTRIDLILELISRKPDNNREEYYTFFKFDEMHRSGEPLDNIWRKIYKTFLLLKDWHDDHELYHKIGYLVASETIYLHEIFENSKDKTKDEFKKFLDDKIKESILIDKNYSDLSYENTNDQQKIKKLLFLFNVESVRKIGEQSQRFPFDKYKKTNWSLEHIHAQHSEGLRTQENWKEWLELHIPSVRVVSKEPENMIERMKEAISDKNLTESKFNAIQLEVVKLLSEQGDTEYIHSISNMALLSAENNSALNNSTFDVKRNEIIKMDKKGSYIPLCTKNVFLKYYTSSGETQLHFWGHTDRKDYVKEINTMLKDYLNEEIVLEKEEK